MSFRLAASPLSSLRAKVRGVGNPGSIQATERQDLLSGAFDDERAKDPCTRIGVLGLAGSLGLVSVEVSGAGVLAGSKAGPVSASY